MDSQEFSRLMQPGLLVMLNAGRGNPNQVAVEQVVSAVSLVGKI